MAQKFRKVDPRIWNDEKFTQLNSEGKLLALWMLAGNRVNRCGILLWSAGLASEETGITRDSVDTVYHTVCQTLNWSRDTVSKTVFLTRWWKYNQPDNVSAFMGAIKDLHDVPNNSLKDCLLSACDDLPLVCREHYTKAIDTVYHTVSYTVSPQKQEQKQEKKQKTEEPPTPQGGQGVPTVVAETTATESAKPPVTDAPPTRKTRTPAAAVLSPVIPTNLDTPDFRTTWEWWQEDRKARKKPMTAHAMELQLAKLAKYPTLDAIEMLVNSITNGWAGLFPLDVKGKNYGNGNRNGGTVGRLGRAESGPDDFIELVNGSNIVITQAELEEDAARMQRAGETLFGPSFNSD